MSTKARRCNFLLRDLNDTKEKVKIRLEKLMASVEFHEEGVMGPAGLYIITEVWGEDLPSGSRLLDERVHPDAYASNFQRAEDAQVKYICSDVKCSITTGNPLHLVFQAPHWKYSTKEFMHANSDKYIWPDDMEYSGLGFGSSPLPEEEWEIIEQLEYAIAKSFDY